MTAAVDKATPSGMRRLFSYYRLQARLLWEWRPTRLAILRRTVLSFLAACPTLAVTAALLPGLGIDGRSHGGLGGWQGDPFMMCPPTLTLAEDPPRGAPALSRQLVACQAQLRSEPRWRC